MFRRQPVLIGMVHLLPLPGSPRSTGGRDEVLARACADADALAEGGADGVMVENFGDVPFFPERCPPYTVAQLTRIATELRRRLPDTVSLGVNVLRNDAASALAVATAAGADFIRVNVHAGAAVTDQGLLEGRAHETLRLRSQLGSQVAILADVAVKHARPLGGAIDPAQQTEELLHRSLADGVIVSGTSTGAPVDIDELRTVFTAARGRPVLIGSGFRPERAAELLRHASGAIVGTWLKEDGQLDRPVDVDRVRALAACFRGEEA